MNGSVSVSTKVFGVPHTFMTCKDRMVIGDYEALGHTGNRFTYTAAGRRTIEILSLPAKPFIDILTERYPNMKKDLFVRAAVNMHVMNKLLGSYLDERRIPVRGKAYGDTAKFVFLHVVNLIHETPAVAYNRLKSSNKECVETIEKKFEAAKRIVDGMKSPLKIIKSRVGLKGGEEKE